MKTKLSWSERFALIDHYNPTDEQIVRAFNLSQAELITARSLRSSGTLAASKDIDPTEYTTIFTDLPPAPVVQPTTPTSTTTIRRRPTMRLSSRTAIRLSGDETTDESTDDASQAPRQTAMKKNVGGAPKKRGRKGSKILDAFRSIPTTPTPAEAFSRDYKVSLPVLRQSKRFDTCPELGTVKVKVNKHTNILEIWREPPGTPPSA